MSNLKPGATYIYEQADGIVYAREPHSLARIEIGRMSDRVKKDQLDWDLWKEIVLASQSNITLQTELERVKMLYLLIKKDSEIQHHPV